MTIVSGKSAQKQTRNNARLVRAFATAAALVVGAMQAQAQDEATTVTHFLDSNTDRVPLLTAFPSYPSIARRDRIEGEATVCFIITTDGRITKVKLQNATHGIFKKPALKAIKRSTFEPLAPNQIFATARTCRTYRFNLEPIVVDNDDE